MKHFSLSAGQVCLSFLSVAVAVTSFSLSAVEYDFDGDGKADVAVRRAATFYQYIKNSADKDIQRVVFGKDAGDIPVSGDFDGDGIADVAVRRPSNSYWYIKNSSNGEIQRIRFGLQEEDIPVPADYDGDGITDVAVRRPSNQHWYIKQSTNGEIVRHHFGRQEDDIPVPADYDGDGKADIAVRRASNQMWYIKNSSNGEIQRINFGKQEKDIPVPADYDGDGKADVAVRRPSNQYWYIKNSSDGSISRYHFGRQSEDIPIVADYDGDGKADVAVRRASNQYQYIRKSSDGEIMREYFGKQTSDIPIAAPVLTRIAMVQSELVVDGPVISVSPQQNLYESSLLVLQATPADDTENNITYLWQQVSGTSVDIVEPDSSRVQVWLPHVDANETMQFSVTAKNASGGETVETVMVNILNSENNVSLDAGPDTTIDEGETRVLSGQANDPENVFTAVYWTQLDGDAIEWAHRDTFSPEIVVSGIDSDTIFEVIVTATDNSGYAFIDKMTLFVNNMDDPAQFSVMAPDDITVTENSSFDLTATLQDEDNQLDSVEWSQVSGVTVTMEDADALTLKVTAPEVSQDETVVLRVSATPKSGNIVSDEITVLIRNTSSSVTFNMTCQEPIELNQAHPVNNMNYEHYNPTALVTTGVYNKVVMKHDFNGDGLDDLLMGGSNGSSLEKDELMVLLSDGDGTFTEATETYLSNTVALAYPVPAKADFNGDGVLDVVIIDQGNTERGQAPEGGFYGEAPVVLLSQADGTYQYSTQLAEHYLEINGAEEMHAKSVAVGDIDRDGDIDIFVESGGGTNIIGHFLMNDGNGNFTQDYNNRLSTDLLSGGEQYSYQWRYAAHSIKDMNQDGAPDLVMGRLKRIDNGQELNFNKIAYNDGNGYFTAQNVVVLPGVEWNDDYTYVKSIITEDINGDGAVDILFSHERGNSNDNPSEGNTGRYIQALISNCAGDFTDETGTFFGDQSATTPAMGYYGSNINRPNPMIYDDANGDGLEDLIMAGTAPVGEEAPYVYIRKDDRTFEIQYYGLFTLSRWFGEDAYPIDLNGDGIMDLIHADLMPGADNSYGTGDEVSQIISTIVTQVN